MKIENKKFFLSILLIKFTWKLSGRVGLAFKFLITSFFAPPPAGFGFSPFFGVKAEKFSMILAFLDSIETSIQWSSLLSRLRLVKVCMTSEEVGKSCNIQNLLNFRNQNTAKKKHGIFSREQKLNRSHIFFFIAIWHRPISENSNIKIISSHLSQFFVISRSNFGNLKLFLLL